jgi:Protein of unknown function (DUF2380)
MAGPRKGFAEQRRLLCAKSLCRRRADRKRLFLLRGATVGLALAALFLRIAAADETKLPTTVAFFGFQLINTSLQPTSPAEDQRTEMLDQLFRERLDSSGRFKIVPIPPELQQKITAGPEISGCNGCERGYAQIVGADWAAWGTVQKVSNLILNINLYMEDAVTGKMEFVKSVDIRGNTGESWQHGLDYMLRHYLFGEP